jgi:putative transposase
MFLELRQYLGPVFHELARQKECQMIEGHLLPDHVHMCLEIPPK